MFDILLEKRFNNYQNSLQLISVGCLIVAALLTSGVMFSSMFT